MKEKLIRLLEESTARCVSEGLFEVKSLPVIELEVTRDEAHGDGCALLDALELVTSWEAWERLRTSQALTRDRARTVLQVTLTGLLRG